MVSRGAATTVVSETPHCLKPHKALRALEDTSAVSDNTVLFRSKDTVQDQGHAVPSIATKARGHAVTFLLRSSGSLSLQINREQFPSHDLRRLLFAQKPLRGGRLPGLFPPELRFRFRLAPFRFELPHCREQHLSLQLFFPADNPER